MIKVVFNGSKKAYEVSFSRMSEHVCTLIGAGLPKSKKGFLTFRASDDMPLGDWSEYTTIYRVLDDGLQFSDDGSVWIEPIMQEIPLPDSEIMNAAPQPTQIDRIEAQVLYTALMTDTLLEDEEVEA